MSKRSRSEVLSLGFRASTCAGLCIHAPIAPPPPHFQGSVGGGTSCAQRTS